MSGGWGNARSSLLCRQLFGLLFFIYNNKIGKVGDLSQFLAISIFWQWNTNIRMPMMRCGKHWYTNRYRGNSGSWWTGFLYSVVSLIVILNFNFNAFAFGHLARGSGQWSVDNRSSPYRWWIFMFIGWILASNRSISGRQLSRPSLTNINHQNPELPRSVGTNLSQISSSAS